MSKQQPQSARLINTLLIATLAFLGFQLIFNAQGPKESRPSTEIYTAMEKMAARLEDLSLGRELNAYLRQVGVEADKAKWTPDQRIEAELRGVVLVVDTELKSALYRRQVDKEKAGYAWDKMNRAYTQHLKPRWQDHNTKEVWKKEFPVVSAPRLGLPSETSSPDQLYTTLVKELSLESQKHNTWGLFPGYYLIDFLVKMTGAVPGFSYWFAGFLLALLVRIIIFPLAQKQIMWGRQMSQLQPYMAEIKEKFTDKKTGQIADQQAYTAESMKLYKEYGINPMAGCGPMLIQLPFFLLIYNCMLAYQFEFTKGSFFWIHPGATSFLGIPIGPNLGERDYILIALYGVSMIVATYLQPVSDPSNMKQQRIMGMSVAVLFSVMMFFWPLPSAFVVYWTFANILSTAQSLITYRLPMPPLQKVATVKGGMIPGLADGHQPKVDKFLGKSGTPKTVKPKKKGDASGSDKKKP